MNAERPRWNLKDEGKHMRHCSLWTGTFFACFPTLTSSFSLMYLFSFDSYWIRIHTSTWVTQEGLHVRFTCEVGSLWTGNFFDSFPQTPLPPFSAPDGCWFMRYNLGGKGCNNSKQRDKTLMQCICWKALCFLFYNHHHLSQSELNSSCCRFTMFATFPDRWALADSLSSISQKTPVPRQERF